jgi:hypothetical protein
VNPTIAIKGSVTITGCKFTTQSASQSLSPTVGVGGAFYFDTVQLSIFTLDNCDVVSSTAKTNGGVYYVQ